MSTEETRVGAPPPELPAETPPGSRGFASRVRHVPGPPVVAARVWLRGGARSEEVPGQALVTGRLLSEGSRRRSWREIALAAEDRGASIQSLGTGEATMVSIDALAEDWEAVLEWLAELVLEPAFPEERFEWIRRQVGAELESLLDQPDVRTARAFLEQLYHPHPYSRALHGDPASLAHLDAAGCAEHHRRSLTWGGCAVVTGQVDEARVGRRLEELFGHLDQAAGELPPVPPPLGLPQVHREVVLPGSEQAHLYAGHPTVPRNHPSIPALDLLGVVLGAGAGLSGRLPERIREREGLAYTVDCATASGAGIDPGRLVVYAGTSPKTAAQAEKAVREELRRLVEGGIEREELEEARSYLIGRDPFRRETARQWADLLAEAELYGLPTDRPGWQVERLRALHHRDVEEAARRFLRPDDVRVTLGVPG